ncbi:hypothetical protein SLS62_010432 [Diatrype stigma]|uniref:Uncharacterized protein n=1 Tax=Diatrype stigma TaxID=117547 RepID=A0AAN9UCB4_9PEZI
MSTGALSTGHYRYHSQDQDSNQSQGQGQGRGRAQDKRIPVVIGASSPALELHHPDPILPSNHSCSWKDRYLALASETRMLKAEVSARADVMGEEVPQFAFASISEAAATRGSEDGGEGKSHHHHRHHHHHKQQQQEDGEGEREEGCYYDDDDIGLEGVTIVMHMRDKDDLIIDTDLTQGQTQSQT